MQYSNLGRSRLMVSKICLGTMFFGERTPEQEAFRIMDRCLELGINFFDTANRYGGPGNRGGSEAIIGRWFAQPKIALFPKIDLFAIHNRMKKNRARAG